MEKEKNGYGLGPGAPSRLDLQATPAFLQLTEWISQKELIGYLLCAEELLHRKKFTILTLSIFII